MKLFFKRKQPRLPWTARFRSEPLELCLIWCIGLCIGCRFAVHNTGPLCALMNAAVRSRVSIVGLFTTLCVPFMISVLSLRFHVLILIYLTAFCQAVTFGFCTCAVYSCFGSAGWLIRCLLLFPETVSCTALLWLWIRGISGSDQRLSTDAAVCGAVITAAGLADYLAVSPFLAGLWNFT